MMVQRYEKKLYLCTKIGISVIRCAMELGSIIKEIKVHFDILPDIRKWEFEIEPPL